MNDCTAKRKQDYLMYLLSKAGGLINKIRGFGFDVEIQRRITKPLQEKISWSDIQHFRKYIISINNRQIANIDTLPQLRQVADKLSLYRSTYGLERLNEFEKEIFRKNGEYE